MAEKDDFKFPDEIDEDTKGKPVDSADDEGFDIEIVDDTPPEDRNVEPLPEEIKVDLEEADKKKKHPPLNKPHRGGSKKFYVYVRKPGGGIKKVSFGQAGMSAKINNPKARQAFSKRHDCPNKKDRTKASYWSCRLPRYAKLLGLKSNFSGFW